MLLNKRCQHNTLNIAPNAQIVASSLYHPFNSCKKGKKSELQKNCSIEKDAISITPQMFAGT
jgi:hypothetical protein